jgi:hypothetical protein
VYNSFGNLRSIARWGYEEKLVKVEIYKIVQTNDIIFQRQIHTDTLIDKCSLIYIFMIPLLVHISFMLFWATLPYFTFALDGLFIIYP